MKCAEVEKQIDLMIDGELDWSQKSEVEKHCLNCLSCQKSYEILQKTKNVLKKQPHLLPTSFLDQKILQAFESHHQPKTSFWKRFLIPAPAFGLILLLACGSTFLLGRMSVSQADSANKNVSLAQPEPRIERIIEKSEPEIVTVTKYVKVPVIREKKVIKFVSTKNPNQKIETASKLKESSSDFSDKTNALITRINLNSFQPTAELNVKVIKKGDINE